MKTLSLILIFAASIFAVKDIGEINLIKVDSDENVYKKLILSEDGFLSAPPMVVLDVPRLKNYYCFRNMRSNRWSLGIPIIFWNQTYMDRIAESVKKINFFKKFHSNLSELILPPSRILAYRMNWRRRYESFEEDIIRLDSFWYKAASNYVLPKHQSFILEFKSANNSEELCKSLKTKLLNETLQSQELTVDFVVRKQKKETVPVVLVKIGDIKSTKLYNESKCENKDNCIVSQEYAEKWAYEVSAVAMKRLNVVHLSLQKEIYDSIIDTYLCKDKISISELESKIAIVKRLSESSKNEMGCKIPSKVYTVMKEVCEQVRVPKYNPYGNRNYEYERQCKKQSINYNSEIVVQLNTLLNFNEKNEFSVPVKRYY